MMRKSGYDYFKMFIRAAEYSSQAADILKNVIRDYEPEGLKEKIKEIHAVEQAADHAKHEMNRELTRAFITPIEREDIMLLSQYLDDVTDCVEDVLLRLYMFNVLSIRDDALEFAQVIFECCEAMEGMMKEFRNFKKSNSISKNIVEINNLEEKGDALYTKAVRKLYINSTHDAVQLLTWRDIYDRMEKCCDACEHVANAVEGIIMKNT